MDASAPLNAVSSRDLAAPDCESGRLDDESFNVGHDALPVAENQGHQSCGELCVRHSKRTLQQRWRLLVPIAVGVGIYAIPRPAGIDHDGWSLVAIFIGTIVGILLQTLPAGACAIIGASMAVLTGTLKFSEAFNGFSQQAPWIIAIAIFLATGINKTKLGERIACAVVHIFGSTTLGLTYSLVISEFLLGPAIPSVAARSGAIVLPIIRSLAEVCGSKPGDGTERQLGAYLMVTCFQTAAVTCATFLTGSHPNPLSAALAEEETGKELSWLLWTKGAIVPALVDIFLIPLVIWLVYPPRMRDTTQAKTLASAKLRSMGPMKRGEWTMLAAMLITVALWLAGPSIGVSTVVAGSIGLMIVLVLEVIEWEDCLATKMAWDTMTWLSILMAMANQLKEKGVIDVVQKNISSSIDELNWHWYPSLLLLVIVYVYAHYLFASNIAHVAALYTSFLAVMISVGSPPLLASLVLSYFSNMMGAISHYGMTHGPLFFGQGYVPLSVFLGIGLLVSVVNFVVWMGVGSLWWWVLGYM
ncbi:unnamed protein product [Ostreobium quekettii]|uniref:Uncharacterized protein n=1 Tax=Ostreobium quekettii TaxID=121088 RepID=A0A8S1J6E3_9CHLO|nr:unnamed protein product [Ostreobium quekettii]